MSSAGCANPCLCCRSTWVAATTEGLLVYSLDEETMFDPTDLGEDVTPAAAASALQQGAHARALLLELRLKDLRLVRRILEAVPPAEIRANAQAVPHVYLFRMLVRSRLHDIAAPRRTNRNTPRQRLTKRESRSRSRPSRPFSRAATRFQLERLLRRDMTVSVHLGRHK